MDIICGVDFTEAGGEATQIAAQLALRLGDRLILAHAWEQVAGPDDGDTDLDAAAQARQAAQDELQTRATSLQTVGIDVVAHTLDGPSDRVLIDVADSMGPRLLVVGTSFKGGIKALFSGSIAEQVAQRAHYPVLIVSTQPGNMMQWSVSNRPLRVTLAMDGSGASESAIAWVKELRTRLAVDLSVVHFYFPPHEHRRLGLAADKDNVEDPSVVQTLLQELDKRIGEMPGEGSFNKRVYANWVSVAERLCKELESHPADLLILGAHQRSVFSRLGEDSVIMQMLHHTQTPILCVPSGPPPSPAERRLPELQTVLAAVDLAADSQNAAAFYAYALLRGRGGKIHLCHIIGNEEHRALAEAAIAQMIPAQAAAYGINTEVHIVVGSSP
ncbi:MAG: universal stress protein, partial [Deltaproteobacteria bacterium]